jgi:Trk K+ transport system NAD-binding subunit
VPRGDHVIVVGANHLGARVIMNLLEENVAVVVLESEVTGQYSLDLKRQIAVVDGNPRSTEALNRAGIQTASAMIALMDDDVENLGMSLAAKKFNPSITTITQIFDFGLASKLQDEVEIDRVLSTSGVAAPYFAAAVFGGQILLAVKWKDYLIFLSRSEEPMASHVEGQHEMLGEHLNRDIQISSIPLSGRVNFN